MDELAQRVPKGRSSRNRHAGPKKDHKGRGRCNRKSQEVKKLPNRAKRCYTIPYIHFFAAYHV